MVKQFIACDLDGTLAKYDGWKGKYHIGEVIPEVASAIAAAQKQGDEVWIFTARVSDPEDTKSMEIIHKWLSDNNIRVEGVTCVKFKFFTQFWDDRALQVIKNQGIFVINPAQLDTDEMPTAPIFLPDDSQLDKPRSPLDIQEGGSHYKKYAIQPIEFVVKNNIPVLEANALKYVVRHADKNGMEDLRKARHYLELMAEMYYGEKL